MMRTRPGAAAFVTAQLTLSGLTALALCSALSTANMGALAQTPAAPPPAVLVQPAALQEMTSQRDFLGRVHASDKVDLRARVEGFLEKRLFTEGGFVKEGELLFQIDKAPFQAEVEQREADLAAAEAVLKNAEVQLARAEELVGKQAVAHCTPSIKTL